MLPNDILLTLTRLLGPLKTTPQEASSHFDKFQDLLKQSLTQPALEIKKDSLQFPDFQTNMLPDDINDELEKMTDAIVAAQAARKPTDPVFWLRQRNFSVTAGFEESAENFIEPSFTFGPFVNQQSKQVWFDFFQVPKQLRFQVANIPDYLVIALPLADPFPSVGSHTVLNFQDCTIWISAKTLSANGDKRYTGIRAKNCVMKFSGEAIVPADGMMLRFSSTFTLSFEPFDSFTNGIDGNAQPKAGYPDKIVLSFSGPKWSLQTFGKSVISAAGDSIDLGEGANINPSFLEAESLIHVPLPAGKNSWQILGNDAERFRIGGEALVSNTGWYLPVISTNFNAAGLGVLGMNIFSGYLGFRGKDGLKLDWPGLENGKLIISKFLLLARPGRINLKYTYTAAPRIKQQLPVWKSGSTGDDRSLVKIVPAASADGNCIIDNQQMEVLLQPARISARADRPLNTGQQRFDIVDQVGAIVFIKIANDTSVIVIGSYVAPPPVAGVPAKQRIPQSLCLTNALLTVDNPISVFIEGRLINDIVTEGFFRLIFPVYRLINTLPDPYISNQFIIDDQSLLSFTELLRTGKDTLNDQFLFTVTSVVQWNDVDIAVGFTMNQPALISRTNDLELSRAFPANQNLCASIVSQLKLSPPLPADIIKIRTADPANVVGSYDFMKLLPGDRSLVDVSGSANQWGVSFSINIGADKKLLPESIGFPASFPFRIKDMDLVSSGRMSRLFTLPHIQWEPVMKIDNPLVDDPDIPAIINFNRNGNPTRISSAHKAEVALSPGKLYEFILDGFNKAENPNGITAHFSLPFGICAFAYFSPKKISDLPGAAASANEPSFSGKKTGALSGAMQLLVEAIPPSNKINPGADQSPYFIGSASQQAFANNSSNSILGNKITNQFGEFSIGTTAKVPLQRIDFSGYGASIFSNWHNDKANFGRVNQVKFDVLIGRTAHEVVQIKSILFPWGVPVVRSIVMQRKNTGMVTRYDSGWIAQGPGEFDFLSHTGNLLETNPYNFHPGMVTGIYNVREIKDLPEAMDITFPVLGKTLRFSGVYFNGDIQMENITKGAMPKTATDPGRVHSVGQWGYVMLADPGLVTNTTTLTQIFPPALFKQLLNDPKIGGSLGGPINAVMNIAASGQRIQVTRVDISASNETNPSFVVAARGTIDLPKEGSWTVVKCLPSKDIIPLNPAEAVPIIRNGVLSIDASGKRVVKTNQSRHSIGDPAEIDKYILNGVPALQYSFLQTTGTQKLLFRRPSFLQSTPKIFHDIPDLADAFRLLDCKTIFPNLSKTLSLPDKVKELNITGDGSGLKFDDSFFNGPVSLNNFVPPQLNKLIPASMEYKLIDESGFQVFITYSGEDKQPSAFQVDLSSDAIDEAADGARKKWQTINKDVAIVVNLGSIKPLLTLRGKFRSEAGMDPVFENPACVLGDELQAVKDILQVLAILAGKGDEVADSLHVVMGNSPNSWNYKMSIEQRIPVIQFPSTAEITLSTPPPLIIEASLLLGVFFNLSLSPDPKNLIKPGAGASFGFEGMIQIQLITIGIAAAYGVGITKIKAYVDLTDPKPQFEFTFGFGATVIVDLPVVGLVSVTRAFSLAGNIDSGSFRAIAGQMLRGVLSLAGGLLIVAIQIEGSAGVQRKDKDDPKTTALFEMIFTLDVSLAFVISYDFSKSFTEEIALN